MRWVAPFLLGALLAALSEVIPLITFMAVMLVIAGLLGLVLWTLSD